MHRFNTLMLLLTQRRHPFSVSLLPAHVFKRRTIYISIKSHSSVLFKSAAAGATNSQPAALLFICVINNEENSRDAHDAHLSTEVSGGLLNNNCRENNAVKRR